jgi:hypothetical protein
MKTLLTADDQKAMNRLKITQEDRLRFAHKLKQYRDCLLWTGSRNAEGYGKFKFRTGMTVLAHRFAYFAQHSLWMLPTGRVGDMCHIKTCPNRACCNPSHLYLGTRRENIHTRDNHKYVAEVPVFQVTELIVSGEQMAEVIAMCESEIVI